MNAFRPLTLFAPSSSRELGERVAAQLGQPLASLEERDFADGEHKWRPLESVRDHDVFVISSLFDDSQASVNDKLVRLLFLVGCLNDAGAGRLTALVPYLCYARKDRRTKSRDPVTTRYVATLFEAVGLGRMVTVDVHNLAAYQNAFRIPAEHLEAQRLFADHCHRAEGPLAVISPDVGGVKRAEAFRQVLERRLERPVGAGFMEKHRSAGQVSGEALVGDVAGRTVLLLDDLIASGGTLVRAATACRRHGAARVVAMATHAAFTDTAAQVLADPALDEVVVTDTIPLWRDVTAIHDKLAVLDTSALLAQAIHRLHGGGSLTELLET